MRIFVEAVRGGMISLDAAVNDSIADVKHRIRVCVFLCPVFHGIIV
jgi:hypothetical protein